jgi:hypothetical protein
MEKAEQRLRQVRCMETSASKPLMKYRKVPNDDVKIGKAFRSRDQSGGYLFLGQMASGI